MRRADDLDVQAERIVPPVIERRRGDHHHAAPASQKGAERPAESPNFYGSRFGDGIVSPSGGENQIRAGEAHQDSAELDKEVRGSPEGVAADAHVPGDVPVEAEND